MKPEDTVNPYAVAMAHVDVLTLLVSEVVHTVLTPEQKEALRERLIEARREHQPIQEAQPDVEPDHSEFWHLQMGRWIDSLGPQP